MKQHTYKTIVILGGVFDPIHNGHISIYRAIQRKIHPNKFIVTPSKYPPLKNNLPIASSIDRYNMLKLAFNNFKNVEISKYEISKNNNDKSYTYITINHFKKIYPYSCLYFVVGSDRFNDFKQWKNYKQILNKCHLIVINRDQNKLTNNIENTVYIKIKPIQISSKQLRKIPDKKYLNPKVIKYIQSHHLYMEEQIKSLMSAHRFQHTLRVCKLAQELAKSINNKLIEKAYIASMYHDIAKEMLESQSRKLIKSYDKKRFPTFHTTHGLVSAIYAHKYLNINDKEILNAIKNHVIPNNKPTTLDMILYCADKLEPKRTKDDVKNRIAYIRLAKINLKQAFYKLLKETQQHYK